LRDCSKVESVFAQLVKQSFCDFNVEPKGGTAMKLEIEINEGDDLTWLEVWRDHLSDCA